MVKKHGKLKLIILVASVLVLMLLIVFLVGKTFAFFQYAKKGDVVNVITISGLNVNVDESTTSALNITDAYPQYDGDGLNNNPFTFTVTNATSKNIDYSLKLLNDSEKQALCYIDDEETTQCTLLPYQYIRYAYSINDGEYSEPLNLTENGNIYSETLSGGSNTKISIKIWIDSTAPNSIQGNVFFGKLILSGEKSLFDSSLPASINLGSSYTIARTAEADEVITCSSDKDGVVTNTSTLTTIGTHVITCTSTKNGNTFSASKNINVTAAIEK